MPALKIQRDVWKGLLVAGEKQHRKPEILAHEALKDFLRRTADDELLERSSQSACRPLRARDAENAIRHYRRNKR
jgi:hypothetical protein